MLSDLSPETIKIIAWVAAFLLLAAYILSKSVQFIPNNRVGVVEKLISRAGSIKGGLIARHGEAGFQPKVLRGGWHAMPPFQFRLHRVSLVTIPQGKIGYVFARDGAPLLPSQSLAKSVPVEHFQDTAAFLANGGQKRPAAYDPARGHLRHQPCPVCRHYANRSALHPAI